MHEREKRERMRDKSASDLIAREDKNENSHNFNFYSFFQMRYTKRVSMWPVGLITKFGVSTPIVKNGTISGFYDGWIGGRKFPVSVKLQGNENLIQNKSTSFHPCFAFFNLPA